MPLLLLFLFLAAAAAADNPAALLVPVYKDPSTRQYLAHLDPVRTVLDLGGPFLWVHCDSGPVSPARPVRCGSVRCATVRSTICLNKTACGFLPNNPFTKTSSVSELREGILVFSSKAHLVFGCGPLGLLNGLAHEARGIAGLGRNPAAVPSQLAAELNLPRRFSLCLSGTSRGAAVFGGRPRSLSYTPLLVNPKSTAEYFIGVTSVKVNGKTVAKVNPVDFTARISTVEPYTVFESSVFRAVTAGFARDGGFRRAAPVGPFGFCFDSSNAGLTGTVPRIDLVLQSELVVWSVAGANSVVEVGPGVSCLAFVDGGRDAVNAIVIGGYQLEDNLLEFDLAGSRLGFSGHLLSRGTDCANLDLISSS